MGKQKQKSCDHERVAGKLIAIDGGVGGMGMAGPSSKPKSLNDSLEELYSKRGSAREDALYSIIQILTNRVEHEFVEKNFATMLYLLSSSLKKGTVKEVALASNAIGLIAMTIRCSNKSHELYEESVPLLSNSLKSNSRRLEMMNSLAIVTFFCADNSEETEKSMQILWRFIKQMEFHAADERDSLTMLAGEIYAWSFLLSTLDGWRINSKHWKGVVSYLSSLLEGGDEMLQVVAAEALYMIAEIGSVEKFTDKTNIFNDFFITDPSIPTNKELPEKKLKDDIRQVVQGKVPGTFCCTKEGTFQKKLLCFGKETLVLSTWSELMQVNYMKRFLGRQGFLCHIQNNKLLREMFEFLKNKKQPSLNELSKPESEEVVVHYLVPGGRPRAGSQEIDPLPFVSKKEKAVNKRVNDKSTNSARNKARTQLMNKKRLFAEQRKTGHLISED